MKKAIFLTILVPMVLLGIGQNVSKGFEAIEAKNFEEAEAIFSKALEKEPNDASAFIGMCRLYLNKGWKNWDAEKSLSYLIKAEEELKNFDANAWSKLEKMGLNPAELLQIRTMVEKRFLSIIDENPSEDAYNQWVERFPNSTARVNCEKARNVLASAEAEKGGTIESYSSFLKKYPTAVQAAEIMAKRDQMAMNEAKASENSGALALFIKNYPSSALLPQAEQMLHTRAYDEAKEIGTSAALMEYAAQYPTSVFADMAKKLANEKGN